MVMTSRRGSSATVGSGSSLERGVTGSNNVLVKIDVRPGHQAGFVGAEISASARHFLRIDQTTKRFCLDSLLEPAVLGAVVSPLDVVLAWRRHPADIEPIHTDAEFEQRMGDVAGQGGERALGGAISRVEWLAAVGRHRLDVDDRARNLFPAHDAHALLNEEEWPAHVHVEDLVVALLGGVENIAPI